MTDWKPGDRFKLECEGEIRGRGSNWVELNTGNPMGTISFGLEWFDAHATKIQRRFQFGDWVEFQDRSLPYERWQQIGIVVCDQDRAGFVNIARKDGKVLTRSAYQITLIKPVEDL